MRNLKIFLRFLKERFWHEDKPEYHQYKADIGVRLLAVPITEKESVHNTVQPGFKNE